MRIRTGRTRLAAIGVAAALSLGLSACAGDDPAATDEEMTDEEMTDEEMTEDEMTEDEMSDDEE